MMPDLPNMGLERDIAGIHLYLCLSGTACASFYNAMLFVHMSICITI